MTSTLGLFDLVWARQKGYPWWPGVIAPAPEEDPRAGLWCSGPSKKTKYHVIYLAWDRERAWIEEESIKRFKRDDGGKERKKCYVVKRKEFRVRHLDAIDLALEILDDPDNPLNHLEKIKSDVFINEDVGMTHSQIKWKSTDKFDEI